MFNALHPCKVGNDTNELLTEEETEVYGSEETRRVKHLVPGWAGV